MEIIRNIICFLKVEILNVNSLDLELIRACKTSFRQQRHIKIIPQSYIMVKTSDFRANYEEID